jgi:hypothetical protein
LRKAYGTRQCAVLVSYARSYRQRESLRQMSDRSMRERRKRKPNRTFNFCEKVLLFEGVVAALVTIAYNGGHSKLLQISNEILSLM